MSRDASTIWLLSCKTWLHKELKGSIYAMQERRSIEISRPSAVQTRLKWYRGNSIHRMSIDKLNIRTVS